MVWAVFAFGAPIAGLARFAVNSIRCWLDAMGRERYPDMNKSTIAADGGGSNGSRVRLFKVELQKLAGETSLTLQVCRYPPGTSQWNKIELRLFGHLAQDLAGQTLNQQGNRGRTDCRHDGQDRPDGEMRA